MVNFTLDDLRKTEKAIQTYKRIGLSPSDTRENYEQRAKVSKPFKAVCGNLVTHDEIVEAMTRLNISYRGILGRLYNKRGKEGWTKQQALNTPSKRKPPKHK